MADNLVSSLLSEELGLQKRTIVGNISAALTRQKEEVMEELDFEQKKEDAKQRVIRAYAEAGMELDPADVDTAIKIYYDDLLAYKPPKDDFGYKMAKIYCERERLKREYGGLAIGCSTIAAVGLAGIITLPIIRDSKMEKGVEDAVLAAFRAKQSAYELAAELEGNPLADDLPTAEHDIMMNLIDTARDNLGFTDPFFEKYCDDKTPEDDINRDNYEKADRGLTEAMTHLTTAKTVLSDARIFLTNQESLAAIQNGLEPLLNEIKSYHAPDRIKQDAQKAYDIAMNYIGSRNVAEANINHDQLINMRQTAATFSDYSEAVGRLYNAAMTIDTVQEAKDQAEELKRQSERYWDAADVEGYTSTLSGLKALDDKLNEVYTGFIEDIDRRIPEDERRKLTESDIQGLQDQKIQLEDTNININNVAFYYLVVFRDADNNVLRRTVKHPESHQQVTVTKLGYQVDEIDDYRFVKEDWAQDDKIDNNIFIVKKRGELEERTVFNGRDGKPVTIKAIFPY
ncbi:MAG: hypothetical protein KJ709_01325 [Nanoarchaeota archaeon]|nr:hypothetical protein [Nanoarchaeota archaeon]